VASCCQTDDNGSEVSINLCHRRECTEDIAIERQRTHIHSNTCYASVSDKPHTITMQYPPFKRYINGIFLHIKTLFNADTNKPQGDTINIKGHSVNNRTVRQVALLASRPPLGCRAFISWYTSSMHSG